MVYNSIWKFPLKLAAIQKISIPLGANKLHVGKDADNVFCIWAAVDTNAKMIDIEIIIVGTGWELAHVGDFLGTIIDYGYVWHIFTGPSDTMNGSLGFHYQTKDNGDAGSLYGKRSSET